MDLCEAYNKDYIIQAQIQILAVRRIQIQLYNARTRFLYISSDHNEIHIYAKVRVHRRRDRRESNTTTSFPIRHRIGP